MLTMFVGCSSGESSDDTDNTAQSNRAAAPSPEIENESIKPPEVPAI